MSGTLIVVVVCAIVVIFVLKKTAIVVPQQSAYVTQWLGRYHRTLEAGLHIVIPFVEQVAYRHSLKERAIDVPEQICITSDNVQVGVDGILYVKILDPERASYGTSNPEYAVSQLAQTTLRSEMGKIELDRTFEARQAINTNIVIELDKASEPWGIKVLRYEIKNISPPADVISAMEKQMRAEREKRASILQSEGDRDSKINTAEGEKQRVIKESEAHMTSQINYAKGQAEAIISVARATAEGLRMVGEALGQPGGDRAMQLRIAERFTDEFGRLAKSTNTMILPTNMTDIGSFLALAKNVMTTAPNKV